MAAVMIGVDPHKVRGGGDRPGRRAAWRAQGPGLGYSGSEASGMDGGVAGADLGRTWAVEGAPGWVTC